MICSRCGKEVGPLFCGHCYTEIRKSHQQFVPVLYYDQMMHLYHAGCTVLECPCNDRRGACGSGITLDTFIQICHEYDGDNCVKLPCG